MSQTHAVVIDRQRLLSTLQWMVRARSYSDTPGEVTLAHELAGELAGRGLDVTLIPVSGQRVNVLARLPALGSGSSLMLNGHIDTNMAGEGWTKDPFGGEMDDTFIYGIGVSNMKAADAAMIEAVTAVKEADLTLRGEACVALVVGELQGGVGTKALLEAGHRADCFIVGEPTDLSLLTMHAGTFEFRIDIYGRTRHLSKMEEGVSALSRIIEIVRVLETFQLPGVARADHAGIVRLNVGSCRAGMTRDYLEWRLPQLPDVATIKVAARFPPGYAPETFLDAVRAEVGAVHTRHGGDFDFEIALLAPDIKGLMPPFEIDRDHDFVARLATHHRDVTGTTPRIGDLAPYKFYGTDAGHLQAAGEATGVVYGPGGKYNTMPDERVEIRDIVASAEVYARIITDVCA